MKSITFISVLLLFLISANSVKAQNHFKEGFVILNGNDTLFGHINTNLLNQSKFQKCEFKKQINAESVLYSPEDIHAFGIDNNHLYISKTISVDNIQHTMFLECLLHGDVSLFRHSHLKKSIFYIDKDGIIYELSNDKEQIVIDNVVHLKNSNHYKKTLTKIFLDNQDLVSEVRNTKFNQKSLINITEKYNKQKCNNDNCINYKKARSKTSVYLEPNLGIMSSWLGLKTSKQYDNSINPEIGVNISITSPEIRFNKIKFSTGISFSNNSFREHFTNSAIAFYSQSGQEYTHLIGLDYTIIRIPLSISYLFISGNKWTPFATIGYNNIFLIQPTHVVLRAEEINGEIHYLNSDNAYLNTYEHAYFADFGFLYNISNNSNFVLRLGYEYRHPTTDAHQNFLYYIYVNSLKFNIGYEYKF